MDLRLVDDDNSLDGGLCAQTDPLVFFPEKGSTARTAQTVCRKCPVRVPCLSGALDRNETYGVWGGIPERDRRQMTAKYLDGVSAETLIRNYDRDRAVREKRRMENLRAVGASSAAARLAAQHEGNEPDAGAA